MTPLDTRAARLSAALILLALLLAGCGQQASAPPAAASPLVPVLAVSELAPGPNRIALGVLKDGTPLNDPELSIGMRFFTVGSGNASTPDSEATAVYRGEGLPFGLYVGYATFSRPGAWVVELTVPQPDGQPAVSRMRLDVLAEPKVPAVGAPAVPSRNLTVHDEADLSKISSDAKPDPDLYQLTIADAIAARKPFVVAFSTPGYCQTAVCAPNMLVVKKLKEQYKGQVNFIHVEVYPYPYGESFQAQRRVPPMDEWGLRTEPWTFLVDAAGVIQARYEGGITFAEMEPALEQLAAGQPITPPAQ
ncbi:MAG: thioredoxin family protein [Chloroflexales bacterium]|nr:thioredoxin family protein [Chloroflexales bacterium]